MCGGGGAVEGGGGPEYRYIRAQYVLVINVSSHTLRSAEYFTEMRVYNRCGKSSQLRRNNTHFNLCKYDISILKKKKKNVKKPKFLLLFV